MFSQYFGHFLLNKGLISREQLREALEYQESVHVKFGVIAVNEGYMTPEQVEKVHDMQKQVDKRFGEIAIEEGFLTEEQVEQMLASQKQNHLLLAQALVDKGFMTIDQFSKALEDYKKAHALSDENFEEIKQGNIDLLIENVVKNSGLENKEYLSKYLALFAKNMIRFIDRQAYLEIDQETKEVGEWLVTQEITGKAPLFTAISADSDVFLYIASKYAEEKLEEIDELAKASVCEFLNLHNGIFLVNMSNDGIELNMKPQEIAHNPSIGGNLFKISVHTAKGIFQLLLSDRPGDINISK